MDELGWQCADDVSFIVVNNGTIKVAILSDLNIPIVQNVVIQFNSLPYILRSVCMPLTYALLIFARESTTSVRHATRQDVNANKEATNWSPGT